jgi:hypothetical protein
LLEKSRGLSRVQMEELKEKEVLSLILWTVECKERRSSTVATIVTALRAARGRSQLDKEPRSENDTENTAEP